MTAQISDKYFYNGKEYCIVALSKTIGFNPEDYGLEPHTSSSACWRGYWCEYSIEDNHLMLKSLFLYNRDGNYPEFAGKTVIPEEYEKVLVCRRGEEGEWIESYEDEPTYFEHRKYEDVDLILPYTGKILLGNGFIQDYYIHMGFQNGWAYEELIELVFEEGLLTENNDYSDIAKQQREYIDRTNSDPSHPDVDDIMGFVTNCFSLDYREKTWWLDGKSCYSSGDND